MTSFRDALRLSAVTPGAAPFTKSAGEAGDSEAMTELSEAEALLQAMLLRSQEGPELDRLPPQNGVKARNPRPL